MALCATIPAVSMCSNMSVQDVEFQRSEARLRQGIEGEADPSAHPSTRGHADQYFTTYPKSKITLGSDAKRHPEVTLSPLRWIVLPRHLRWYFATAGFGASLGVTGMLAAARRPLSIAPGHSFSVVHQSRSKEHFDEQSDDCRGTTVRR
jgi:hypothetical protein